MNKRYFLSANSANAISKYSEYETPYIVGLKIHFLWSESPKKYLFASHHSKIEIWGFYIDFIFLPFINLPKAEIYCKNNSFFYFYFVRANIAIAILFENKNIFFK